MVKKYENPQQFHELQRKLRKEQKILSRRFEQNVKERIYDEDGNCIEIIYKNHYENVKIIRNKDIK